MNVVCYKNSKIGMVPLLIIIIIIIQGAPLEMPMILGGHVTT